MAVHGRPAPTGPPRLNLDRLGMPKDYATYIWLLYSKRVEDKSPQRLATLQGNGPSWPDRPSTIIKERR